MPHIPEVIRVFTTHDLLLRRGWTRSMIKRHLVRLREDWWFEVAVPHRCLPTAQLYFWENVIPASASGVENNLFWSRQALYREQDVLTAEEIPDVTRKIVYRKLAA